MSSMNSSERHVAKWLALGMVLVTGMLLSGCKPKEGTDTKDTGSSSSATDDSAGDKISVNLAKLSADDRALAEKQKVCPVGGGELGAMGVPYKLTVKDRVVFLCCEHCKGDIEADPDKFLAKLPQ